VFQASDIYGGINGFWDYGPLGVVLKNNIRNLWWHDMVECPPLDKKGNPLRILGLDSSIIQHPSVWEASGHTSSFSDPMVDCKATKIRYRADQLVVYVSKNIWNNGCNIGVITGEKAFAFFEEEEEKVVSSKIKKLCRKNVEDFHRVLFMDIDLSFYKNIVAPDTTEVGTLTAPKAFNLMFETRVGAVVDEKSVAYLRPETAQGIFVNFKNVLDSTKAKIPFGIAQIGKAFRNEVSPRNFIFRSREFEQMELEWFCHKGEAEVWQEFWLEQRLSWWKNLGLDASRINIRRHEQEELAHYARGGGGTRDIEYKFPFSGEGFSELEGIAHRCDYDLAQHQRVSGVRQEYADQAIGAKFIPHVIEPSSGLTRAVLAVLCNAYTEDEAHPSGFFMNFRPQIAPVNVAVLPLQLHEGIGRLAREIFHELRKKYIVTYEDKQSIGKRYAKNDEIGTPYCVTIDFDSLQNMDVTIRDRNTMKQERIGMAYLSERLRGLLW
jgi:glycyl-tRNA synthetase